EVRETQRLVREDALGRPVGFDEGWVLDEQVLVDERLADLAWVDRPEHRLDEGRGGHLGGVALAGRRAYRSARCRSMKSRSRTQPRPGRSGSGKWPSTSRGRFSIICQKIGSRAGEKASMNVPWGCEAIRCDATCDSS